MPRIEDFKRRSDYWLALDRYFARKYHSRKRKPNG